MPKVPKILAFAGSLREKSYNRRVLKVAAEGARRSGSQVDIVDLRDYPMPIFDSDFIEEKGFDPMALKFQELVCSYDGLLIATPEYNGSIPGGMKNMLAVIGERNVTAA